MKLPPQELRALVHLAAQLRATGNSWEKVAKQVGRSARTCRHWPLTYADFWHRVFLKTELQFIAAAANDAITLLRSQLVLPDAKISQGAARCLAQFRGRTLPLELRTGFPPRKPSQEEDP